MGQFGGFGNLYLTCFDEGCGAGREGAGWELC